MGNVGADKQPGWPEVCPSPLRCKGITLLVWYSFGGVYLASPDLHFGDFTLQGNTDLSQAVARQWTPVDSHGLC